MVALVFVGPNRCNGLRSGPGDQYDGTAFESEGFPQFARQILFVRLGKPFVTVDEQEEGRRRLADLRGVKEFQSVPLFADGLSAFDGLVEGAVQ
jgi:hypothetical protein